MINFSYNLIMRRNLAATRIDWIMGDFEDNKESDLDALI